ncbi:MAG: Maf family protein [Candidatus Heimdallarchaeota archaeon]
MKQIVLASGSPRRHELLSLLGIEHEVIPCNSQEESINNDKVDGKQLSIEEQILKVAYQKAKCVADNLEGEKYTNALVIGADTIVVLGNEIIGKPKTELEAKEMLQKLTGQTHIVFTGLCIIDKSNEKILSEVDKTLVSMIDWDDEKIEAYITAEYVMDKAGAYAIQGKGAAMIDKIEGCFYNVMGLPLSRIVSMLEKTDFQFIIKQ